MLKISRATSRVGDNNSSTQAADIMLFVLICWIVLVKMLMQVENYKDGVLVDIWSRFLLSKKDGFYFFPHQV